jgi:hypothetical protein
VRGRNNETSAVIGVTDAMRANNGVDCTRACDRRLEASGTNSMQWSRTAPGVLPWLDSGRKLGWIPSSKSSG